VKRKDLIHLSVFFIFLVISGCSFNWSGKSENGFFIWRQVPQFSLLTSILFWGFIIRLLLKFKHKGWAITISFFIFLAVLSALRSGKMMMNDESIHMRYPIISLKKSVNMKWTDVQSCEYYNRSKTTRKRSAATGGRFSERDVNRGIIMKDDKNEIIIPFAKGKRSKNPTSWLVFTAFKYLMFAEDFEVKDSDNLIAFFKAHLPEKVVFE